MIGGGFFSSLIKHDKVGRAEKLMQDVKRALFNLQRELKDVNLSIPDTVVVSDLRSFWTSLLTTLLATGSPKAESIKASEKSKEYGLKSRRSFGNLTS